jgi:hypothetical protein
MTLYVDGAEQQPISGDLDNWEDEKIYRVSPSFETIAIKCEDKGLIMGIVASVENDDGEVILITNKDWRCTDELNSGWTETEFDERVYVWSAAREVGQHGVVHPESWGVRGSISREAKWIWHRVLKENGNAYCRFSRTNSKYYSIL